MVHLSVHPFCWFVCSVQASTLKIKCSRKSKLGVNILKDKKNQCVSLQLKRLVDRLQSIRADGPTLCQHFVEVFLRAKAATALARRSHRNSVCPFVTWVDQSITVQARITKSSPSAAWKTLVSGSIKLFHKFYRGDPRYIFWLCLSHASNV